MTNEDNLYNVLKRAKRIAIIGNAGSGKSTLAKQLQSKVHLPLYHLDQFFWKPNWTPPDRAEYKLIHDELCARDEWIIEGVNLSLMEYRLARADVIVLLRIPFYLCVWKILKRTFIYYGKETPSSAPGCKEGLGWKFFSFLKWVWDFEAKYPPKVFELLKQHGKILSRSLFYIHKKKLMNFYSYNSEGFL